MTLAQILDLVAQLQAAVTQLQASQASFTQADMDAAVAAAVGPLNDQIAALNQSVMDLQGQVAGVPDQIHAAVVAEDATVAEKIKPLIDQLNEQLAALVPVAPVQA